VVPGIGNRRDFAFTRAPRPEHCAHTGHQLAKGERLRNVVVGAKLEAGYPVALAGPRGEHDDRDVRGRGPGADYPAHLDAAEYGQIEIQNNQIWRCLADRSNGRIACAGNVYFDIAFAFEGMFDKPGNILFIFHDENTGTHTATVVSQRFCRVTERLNVSYEPVDGAWDAQFRNERHRFT
jgi:hypothetical protein